MISCVRKLLSFRKILGLVVCVPDLFQLKKTKKVSLMEEVSNFSPLCTRCVNREVKYVFVKESNKIPLFAFLTSLLMTELCSIFNTNSFVAWLGHEFPLWCGQMTAIQHIPFTAIWCTGF